MPTRWSTASARSVASAFDSRSTCRGASTTFCSTVMCDQRLNCWNTMPSFARIRSTCLRSSGTASRPAARRMRISSPCTDTFPALGISSRLMHRSRVLFPEPLLPRIETTSCSWAVMEMPLSTSRRPKLLWRSSTTRASRGCVMGAKDRDDGGHHTGSGRAPALGVARAGFPTPRRCAADGAAKVSPRGVRDALDHQRGVHALPPGVWPPRPPRGRCRPAGPGSCATWRRRSTPQARREETG